MLFILIINKLLFLVYDLLKSIIFAYNIKFINMKYVAYYRVSTKKQGVSGLGLDAQKEAVHRYTAPELIDKEFTEVETGTSTTNISEIYNRYNDSVKWVKCIQQYIYENFSTYPTFKGQKILINYSI